MIRWSQNDTLFKKELASGYAWQSLPALFFHLNGFEVDVPELKVREHIKEAKNFMDNVDIKVNGIEFEIKSRNESFLSPETFPYETIFVDTVAGYDGKENKPFGYIMISRPTGSMLFLPTESFPKWTKEQKFDTIRRIRDKFYMAPREELCPLTYVVDQLRTLCRS